MMMIVVITMLLVSSCHCLLDDGQTGELAAMATKIQQLEERLAILESDNAHGNIGPIAFTAGLSGTLTTLGGHQQIVFENVHTNLGSAYSASHGHFTAPVAGAYVFYVVITNTPNHSSSIYLMENGQEIGKLIADDLDSNYVTSTIVVTTHLDQGDEVWVQNEQAYSDVEQIDGNNWSTFSGHLIERD